MLSGVAGLVLVKPKRASIYSDSAVALSKAYGLQIDGLLRDIGRIDAEMTSMRTERAALLLELAASRDENTQLRRRVLLLEERLAALAARR